MNVGFLFWLFIKSSRRESCSIKNAVPLIILVIILCIPFLVMLQGQTSKEISCPIPEPEVSQVSIDEIKKTFPIVDYTSEVATNASRKAKSEKYNKIKILEPDITGDEKFVSSSHWAAGLTPLPVEKSQVILIGKVLDIKAFLSENKASVYSEFKIEIEKVLKNKEQQSFEEDKYIKIERQGGVVRYPNNYTAWSLVAGQHMPKLGQKYLFFITKDFPQLGYQKNDFYLLTAYQLKEGRVFPLDAPSGGKHPIATVYKGKEESLLLDELLKIIDASPNNSPK